jgi:aromatic-amino-acid transaminase
MMLEHLTEQPADKILMLMQAFRDDPRDTKIDLGVGVYKNADGVTPVMKAVKAAEKKIWEDQESKSYTSLAGEPLYIEGMIKLVPRRR